MDINNIKSLCIVYMILIIIFYKCFNNNLIKISQIMYILLQRFIFSPVTAHVETVRSHYYMLHGTALSVETHNLLAHETVWITVVTLVIKSEAGH